MSVAYVILLVAYIVLFMAFVSLYRTNKRLVEQLRKDT